ncbi:MAG: hypothetical protein AVDCRST_MAG59-2680, partial [uncultured Thermomicrobiales bacterium]
WRSGRRRPGSSAASGLTAVASPSPRTRAGSPTSIRTGSRGPPCSANTGCAALVASRQHAAA